MRKILTLVMVTEGNKILLGMKKRGFGEGRWNGFGGKVSKGESVEAAARRELMEEVGLTANTLDERGVINFSFAEDEKELEVHIFAVTGLMGQPVESEEMQPEWFSFAEVPYDKMWPDDREWLPIFLEGKRFRGRFHFDRPSDSTYTSRILKAELREL